MAERGETAADVAVAGLERHLAALDQYVARPLATGKLPEPVGIIGSIRLRSIGLHVPRC